MGRIVHNNPLLCVFFRRINPLFALSLSLSFSLSALAILDHRLLPPLVPFPPTPSEPSCQHGHMTHHDGGQHAWPINGWGGRGGGEAKTLPPVTDVIIRFYDNGATERQRESSVAIRGNVVMLMRRGSKSDYTALMLLICSFDVVCLSVFF